MARRTHDDYEQLEDQGATLYAAQTARGLQYDEVPGGGWCPAKRTSSDISAARAGRHLKYDLAAELKASGHTARQQLLCDYLFSEAVKQALAAQWFDLKKPANIQTLRHYCVLALEEMATPQAYKTHAARARQLMLHPKTFIRNHLPYYSKVYQLLDDWALVQYEEMVCRVG